MGIRHKFGGSGWSIGQGEWGRMVIQISGWRPRGVGARDIGTSSSGQHVPKMAPTVVTWAFCKGRNGKYYFKMSPVPFLHSCLEKTQGNAEL